MTSTFCGSHGFILKAHAKGLVPNYWKGENTMNEMIKAYARQILSDHGCDDYSYGGTCGDTILSDLKEAYPNGMEYPYIEVANAILSITKEKPIVRRPFLMVWDNDSCVDGIGCDSFEAAKGDALDTLVFWMTEQRRLWDDFLAPTEDELDDYNYMIENCSVHIDRYNPNTDEYDDYWYPSYEDEEDIGWKTLTMEDIAAEREAYENA